MTEARHTNDFVTIKVGTPLETIEQIMILKTLEATHDDRAHAARLLGISVKTLQRKLRQYSTPR